MDVLASSIFPRGDETGASRGRAAVIITGVLTALAALTVAVRLYTRAGLLKSTGREDWLILGAMAFSFVYLGLVVGQQQYGLGKHEWAISPESMKIQLRCLWIAIPMYNSSLVCTKFSILFNYLRVFPNRRLRLSCYIMMCVVTSYSTWAIVSGYFTCVPVAKFWDPTIKGHCLNFQALWFFNAAMNIITDTTLLIIPMPVLSHLQLPKKQKFALMGVFAVGAIVCITSILRLSGLHKVAVSKDTSWDNVSAAFWTAAECNVAIICACLPYLRPLIARMFPHFINASSYNERTAGRPTTGTFSKHQATMLSQGADFDLYTINIEKGDDNTSRSTMSGIEVTTEMTTVQEPNKEFESISERRLVMQPEP
ncbi:hypothetical protein DTO021C3_599 [Paecilomyces variotii]|nr:hypothetical protein DTO021C3_599 [Paecilomyces variotii]KAJ9398488.1 hypothetical protein DTO282F9_4579 [Paecilomyces variotii]